MPTSTETLVAYIPRTTVLNPNEISNHPSSVKDITADVQQIADVPVEPATTGLSTAAKVGITVAAVVGTAILVGTVVALCVTLIKNNSTSVTTTTAITTTTTTTSTTTVTTTTAAAAPANLVAYRGNNYANYTFSITGATSGGSIWGTTIYTDDSNLAMASVHSGFVTNNVASTITVMILPGQSSYTSTTQNGITSSSYGSWFGSYQIVSATVGG